MAILGYLFWHLSILGAMLFAIGVALLIVIAPNAFENPTLLFYLQNVIYGVLAMFILAVILKVFFPTPSSYEGIFD